jgi:hypothetical protein
MLLSSVAYWDILIIFELCDFVYTECDLFVALHLIDILHLFSKDFLSCKYRGFASEPVAYLYFWYPEVWTDMEAHFQPTNNLSSSNNVQTVLSQTSTIPIRFCEINIEWKKCCRSEKEREREREREREHALFDRYESFISRGNRRCRDRMIFLFTTTCAINYITTRVLIPLIARCTRCNIMW